MVLSRMKVVFVLLVGNIYASLLELNLQPDKPE